MIITSSKLALAQNDFTIDPVLPGLARIHKNIQGKTYTAWVESTMVKSPKDQANLDCFPDMPVHHGQATVAIAINDWTTWKVPAKDYATLEWQAPHYPALQQSSTVTEERECRVCGKTFPVTYPKGPFGPLEYIPKHCPDCLARESENWAADQATLKQRLDNTNDLFRRKATEVVGDPEASDLLVKLNKATTLDMLTFDFAANGRALAKLTAANYAEIGATFIYITNSGQKAAAALREYQ